MRAVVQRVNYSSVKVDGEVVGSIEQGFNVLLGVEENDLEKDALYLAEKIVNLRVFEDSEGKMNLSLLDVGGAMLCISQFTLLGDCRKGRRPSFIKAARPEEANSLYGFFVDAVEKMGVKVETGQFQAHMVVDIQNDGPVTLLVDSQKAF
ncbi:D-aminoacyl-tRNA deacylase [Fusibacter tunisiensis]|jgi:D-tyrosyl-tRNA(Tyr) deacylase|uniref:D-aminoacyl-tRNA deacylase n=1 Tax=Fusibacter tunisiensis TaxID=1008308 RepID=A0ABS2MQE1_9FIRM|nr:D-aminoacyl-tRNA deacylase [Fusibacter tunisiensis]MBM7561614.1 D-tyrosyl-tRNA(Tyr) deacylase [Fusibacter tunisiensis]